MSSIPKIPDGVMVDPVKREFYKSSFMDKVGFYRTETVQDPPVDHLAYRDGYDSLSYSGDLDVKAERQKVYGDPLENHNGIAQMWVSLLQPHWETIKSNRPVPAHVVALMMVALKLNRMRLLYHHDNYVDLRNYLSFAEEWQKPACNSEQQG